jgi:hypothetical protein
MKKIKSGKEEIIYLLTKAIEKFKIDTGQEIIQNTNRKNYEGLAIVLSDISNQLPQNTEEWGTETYTPDPNHKGAEYPYRKYDITGGQIKDALIGLVSHPRHFLIDACYVYLFNMGRKAFEKNIVDENLVEKTDEEKKFSTQQTEADNLELKKQLSALQKRQSTSNKKFLTLATIAAVLIVAFVFLMMSFRKNENEWLAIKKDMSILPYQPTKTEIDSLEGIWLCYTGSPQARISDPGRYHKVVLNLVEIKYKDGYFIYNRFGASFDHIGYMQFESPNLVSIYSRIKSDSLHVESPRHSLLSLTSDKKYLAAISASWNFDVAEKNKIIGIREAYIKLGRGGKVEEVINEIENASCQCKVVRWHEDNNTTRSFYLKNIMLDSLESPELRSLINEKSILTNEPSDALIVLKDSIK